MISFRKYKKNIKALCPELGVERLDIFGSATGADFGPSSDIDVVVRFNRKQGRMFERYFELKERLEQLFNRPVDIVLEDSIKNPYFREAIEHNRVNLYGS